MNEKIKINFRKHGPLTSLLTLVDFGVVPEFAVTKHLFPLLWRCFACATSSSEKGLSKFYKGQRPVKRVYSENRSERNVLTTPNQ